jgi:hypothetical protein
MIKREGGRDALLSALSRGEETRGEKARGRRLEIGV